MFNVQKQDARNVIKYTVSDERDGVVTMTCPADRTNERMMSKVVAALNKGDYVHEPLTRTEREYLALMLSDDAMIFHKRATK